MAVQQYAGGCQCGAVRYEVEVDLASTVTCNCSRCQRLGSVLAFTSEDKFKLLQGKEHLTEYLFNKGVVHHLFCKICGIESFARGTPPNSDKLFVAINVNCLDGVEPRQLNSRHFDGRSI